VTRSFPSMPLAQAAPVVWTEGTICHAVATYIEWWRNAIVPNVYLGPTSREIDLAVLTKAGLLWAFEVKISLADWKRDLGKKEYPACAEPARFYYVVPETLVKWQEVPVRHGTMPKPVIPEWVPKHAGIIFLSNDREFRTESASVTVIDTPDIAYVHRSKAIHRRPLDQKYRDELMMKLGLRYWKHVTGTDMPQQVQVAS
jgi:hypothetical protein